MEHEQFGLMDLSKVRPVPMQKTLMLVNNFVSNTVRFLNHFSTAVEEKLLNVSEKVTELETSLAMLEAKLRSVPELQQRMAAGMAPVAPAAPVVSALPERDMPVPPVDSEPLAPASTSTPTPPSVLTPAAEPPPAEAEGMVPASQHPDYAGFFKMLRVGVPAPLVRQKMGLMGLDPGILDTPGRLLPAPPPGAEEGGEE